MSHVLVRAPRLGQPQQAVGLAEPYRDALIAWTPGGDFGRLGRVVLSGSTNTVSDRAGPYGVGRKFGTYSGSSSTGLRLRYREINPASLLAGRGVTCIAVAHQHTGVNEFPGLIKCGTDGSIDGAWCLFVLGNAAGPDYQHWAFQAGDTSGNTIQEDGTTGQTNTGTAGKFAPNEPCVVIGTWDRIAGKIILWVRGLTSGKTVRAAANQATTAYKSALCPNELLTYCRSTTSQIRSWVTPAYLTAVLPRHITDVQAERLIDNPWALFAERRILVPMPSAGGGPAELAGDALVSVEAQAGLVGSAAALAADAIASAQATAALAEQTTTVITDLDAGNADPTTAAVTDATTSTPIIEVQRRTGADGDGGWRHFLFAVEGVQGKTPVFRWAKASHRFGGGFTSNWAPLYTTDFVGWTKAPSRAIGGTWIEWSFSEALPAGRVYIASHPLGQQNATISFASYLRMTHASVASPAGSADEDGVYATSPYEVDELSREIGTNSQFAFKLAWGGATTDGAPKRRLVMLAGMHAAGEAHSWPAFVAAVEWMLSDSSAEAAAFRSNWDVWLYFGVTPNGWKGGNARWNFRSSQDPNRDWRLTGSSTLVEITALRAAIEADTGGAADVLYSFHGAADKASRFNVYLMAPDIDAGTRRPIMQSFMDLGTPIFGAANANTPYADTNTEFWWGYARLGCALSFPVELQALGESSLAEAQFVGRSWMQTLQAVDAAGHFTADTLAGQAGISAQAQGQLTIPIPLVGASIVAITASGPLSTGIPLSGIAAFAVLSGGVLSTQIRIAVDAITQAIAAADLTTAVQLAAASIGGVQAAGDLTTLAPGASLQGAATVAALAAGGLTIHILFAGSALSSVLGQAELYTPGEAAALQTDATVLAIAAGGLTTAISLQGAAVSVVQAAGAIDIALTLDVAAFVSALASGVLSTQVRLDAAALAGALAHAALTAGAADTGRLLGYAFMRPALGGSGRVRARLSGRPRTKHD